MKLEEAATRLRAHESELRAQGITHVAISGALARDADDGEDYNVLIDADNLSSFTIDDLFVLMQQMTDWLDRRTIVMPRMWAEAEADGDASLAPVTFEVF